MSAKLLRKRLYDEAEPPPIKYDANGVPQRPILRDMTDLKNNPYNLKALQLCGDAVDAYQKVRKAPKQTSKSYGEKLFNERVAGSKMRCGLLWLRWRHRRKQPSF